MLQVTKGICSSSEDWKAARLEGPVWYLPGTTWLAARKCTPLPARTTFLCVLSVLCGFGKCTICQDNEAIFTSLLHNLLMEIKSSEYGPAFSFRRGFIGKAGLLLPTLKK